MKVFVGGASGRVGQVLVSLLADEGCEVVAASRHPLTPYSDRVHPVAFDFHADVDTMAEAIKGCEAVYFVAGSRGADLLQTDAFGAVKLMEACKRAGVRRFIMLSSMFATEPERWETEKGLADLTDYNIAKFFADKWLENSGLNYTIVQAGFLAEDAPTGRIQVNPAHEGSIPLADVAAVLAEVRGLHNTYGKLIMVVSGDEPIDKALKTL